MPPQVARTRSRFVATHGKLQGELGDSQSFCRRRLKSAVNSPAYEWPISCVILFSIILVIIDVDNIAAGKDSPEWLSVSNFIVMVVFLVDLGFRIYAFGRHYFSDLLRVFDFLVVAVDVGMTLTLTITAASFPLPVLLSRIGRTLRILRALRMMTIFPELAVMLKGMAFAAKPLIWGVIMLCIVICFWSVFAVLFIHPLVQDMAKNGFWDDTTCSSRCQRAYESVAMSMLTFCQQLVVGEGWGDLNTPIIEQHPPTALFFMLVLVSTNLAVLNLLLGVIVERAMEAKSVTDREEAAKKDQQFGNAARELYRICRELDTDHSGRVTLTEFREGYEHSAEFADILKAMDLDFKDLELVFSVLDADKSGDLDYEEFVEQLHNMKTHDAHTLLVFIKFYCIEILGRIGGTIAPSGSPSLGRLADGARTIPNACLEKPDTPPLTPTSSCVVEEATAPMWAELGRELAKLEGLREEMLDFGRVQGDRLELVQKRLAAALDAARAPRDASTFTPRRGECGVGGVVVASAGRLCQKDGAHDSACTTADPRLKAEAGLGDAGLDDVAWQDGWATEQI